MPLRLKSPASRLFAQPFVQAHMKGNIKPPLYWPLLGESTSGWGIPFTNGPVMRKVFPFDDVWRHHDGWKWSLSNHNQTKRERVYVLQDIFTEAEGSFVMMLTFLCIENKFDILATLDFQCNVYQTTNHPAIYDLPWTHNYKMPTFCL